MPPGPAYNWLCVLYSASEILGHAARYRASQVAPRATALADSRKRRRTEPSPPVVQHAPVVDRVMQEDAASKNQSGPLEQGQTLNTLKDAHITTDASASRPIFIPDAPADTNVTRVLERNDTPKIRQTTEELPIVSSDYFPVKRTLTTFLGNAG